MTPFRPAVTPLEDRVNPASVNDSIQYIAPSLLSSLDIGPANVFAALAQSAEARDTLAALVPKAEAGMLNIYTVAYLKTFLPQLTLDTQKSATILQYFQNQLGDQAAADPALAPFVGQVAQARFDAEVGAVYGSFLTSSVGGTVATPVAAPTAPAAEVPRVTLFVPPPPPPPAPVLDTTTNAGLTGTLPDLNAAGFVAVGTQGLRVNDVVVGQGDAVDATGSATVFYTGFLEDGTVFDSNRTGTPATFDLSGTVKGFQQGVAGMKPGGIRILDIPSDLGYGAAGSGTSVPPNSRLIFEVKLLTPGTTGAGTGTGTGTGSTSVNPSSGTGLGGTDSSGTVASGTGTGTTNGIGTGSTSTGSTGTTGTSSTTNNAGSTGTTATTGTTTGTTGAGTTGTTSGTGGTGGAGTPLA